MKIEPISSLSVDVVPQAIISLPVEQFVGKRGDVHSESDDLDTFEGASFKIDNSIEIAVRHYQGHPKDTSTIYIDRRQGNVEQITQLIRQILNAFDIPLSALQWERRNSPEL
jgi:hypothetical protein